MITLEQLQRKLLFLYSRTKTISLNQQKTNGMFNCSRTSFNKNVIHEADKNIFY